MLDVQSRCKELREKLKEFSTMTVVFHGKGDEEVHGLIIGEPEFCEKIYDLLDKEEECQAKQS